MTDCPGNSERYCSIVKPAPLYYTEFGGRKSFNFKGETTGEPEMEIQKLGIMMR